MAQKISIGVDANLDTSAVERKINDMGKRVAQANKVQFNPVSVKSIDQVAQLEKQFQQLLKVHGELNRRIKNTGQAGKGFAGTDFDQLYPDAAVRGRQMQKIMEYTLGGGAFSAMPNVPAAPRPGAPAPAGGGGRGGRGGGGVVMPAVNAGLNALGPAGGVAAGALNTGMSAGFGAGLMGLLGGILALGVGKLVSGAMEKVGQAEDNNVALDKLKRTLGDVNVQFEGLKAVVQGGADNLKITYAEAGKLATQFAKLGNMKTGQYTTLADELGVGVGLARSFGLDPSEGTGIMGSMRGVGMTSNVQESRRFALLIGETIAKSDAFAKADEVIGAIGNFATSQTRNNMGGANVSGYAGAFSALVGSGIPGLDPSGAGALLGRINASLSAGGAKGEASQYFTGMIGAGMGLNVYQTRMMREGGAFATADDMFGSGSAYARYKGGGLSIAGGGSTMLELSLAQLRKQHGAGSDDLADATANHLGIGINQAMALLSVDPNKMGGMAKYASLTDLSGSGVGNLSKALYGSGAERQALAQSLMGRTDVSGDEKARIRTAMGGSDEETQKRVLAEIVASRDQEQTTGKDVRDSKNALDNIKTSIADKLVPYMNEARMGIMAIAGVGGKTTSDDIMRKVMDANSAGRVRAINGRIDSDADPLRDRQNELENKLRTLDPANLRFAYRDMPKVLDEKLAERAKVEKELADIGIKLASLETERADLLGKENAARLREIEEMKKEADKRMLSELDLTTTGSVNQSPAETARLGRLGVSVSGAAASNTAGPEATREAMQFFMQQGWSKEQSAGIVANLIKESGLNPGAFNAGDQKNGLGSGGLAQWDSARRGAFEKWSGKKFSESTRLDQMKFVQYELTQGSDVGARRAGALLKDASTAYDAGGIFMKHYERPKLDESASRGGLAEGLAKIQVEVVHTDQASGREKFPRQLAETRVQNNWRAHGPR